MRDWSKIQLSKIILSGTTESKREEVRLRWTLIVEIKSHKKSNEFIV
jgi:hypothetical protein